MKNPKYGLLLDLFPNADAKTRDAWEIMRAAEEVKHKTPLFEWLRMKSKNKIDIKRLRKIFPNAEERDLVTLQNNPDDADAFSEVYFSTPDENFVESLRFVEQVGELGDDMTVEVSATLKSGKTVTESGDYFVTTNYVRSAKLLALELYEKILAKKGDAIIASRATVTTHGETT